MKKLFVLAAVALFVATGVKAVTPAEKEASAARIETLKMTPPKDCGVEKIDAVVAKCKSVADGTVGVAAVTGALSGDISGADYADLQAKIEASVKDFSEVGKMLGDAVGALKELKNPLKLKSATKSLEYAQEVAKAAGEELPYQGKVIAGLVK